MKHCRLISFRYVSLLFVCCALRIQSSSGAAALAVGADVRSFGATGNGANDDTEAIQRAVNAGIGGLHFSKGIFRLTKTVVVELDKVGFTALVGDGTARIVMAGPGPAF